VGMTNPVVAAMAEGKPTVVTNVMGYKNKSMLRGLQDWIICVYFNNFFHFRNLRSNLDGETQIEKIS
jgi:hypothetical protein